MRAHKTNQTAGANWYRLLVAASKKLLKEFVPFALASTPKHVGMFAGSLLAYDSWSETKVPR
jgi:hypothetical protein